MKANEAPEKIYVPTAGDELHYHMTCPNNEFQESIEYTRTDAFIEKATAWLSNVCIEDMTYKYDDFDTSEGWYKFIEDFKQAMNK